MESPPKIAVHGERHELATMRKYGSIGWHTFRHTYSTLHKALEAQQKLMRHADIRTTMDQYGETPMQTRWEATRKVIEIVFDRKSSSGEWSPEAEAGAVGARAS